MLAAVYLEHINFFLFSFPQYSKYSEKDNDNEGTVFEDEDDKGKTIRLTIVMQQ